MIKRRVSRSRLRGLSLNDNKPNANHAISPKDEDALKSWLVSDSSSGEDGFDSLDVEASHDHESPPFNARAPLELPKRHSRRALISEWTLESSYVPPSGRQSFGKARNSRLELQDGDAADHLQIRTIHEDTFQHDQFSPNGSPIKRTGTRLHDVGPQLDSPRLANALETIGKVENSLPDEELAKTSARDCIEPGVSFDELVDRLLAPPASKADVTFITAFLCLYRKFATPFRLLRGIMDRFDTLNGQADEDSASSKDFARCRYVTILQKWISAYPGDFSTSSVRELLCDLLAKISDDSDLALAHQFITNHASLAIEDEDLAWAFSDDQTQPGLVSDSEASNYNLDIKRLSIASLELQTSDLERAQSLRPSPSFAIRKEHWHQLMAVTDIDIAQEITAIDWTLYSAVGPRDFVRYGIGTSDAKPRGRLVCLDQMITHFNHIAFWVANMILFRDKPKHRARMLEKFMNTAWRLRCLNNYHSLGAVIAGITTAAVHRLAHSHSFVAPDIRRRFMRLEILMSTSKSHSAYRLGWHNTTTPRIPFLPLHRRDLVHADEGGQAFLWRNDRKFINWKKFEVMGDIIVDISRSQDQPYKDIRRNARIRDLLLHSDIVQDEDKLYNRSLQLEGPLNGEHGRKKFAIF